MTPPPPSRVATGQVRSRHRIPVICVVTPDRVPPSPARPGLIDRHDLVAALDHAAEKKMTVISAPAGSGKTSLLRAWAGRLGQGRRIAFMLVRQASMTRTGLDNHRNAVTASHRPSGEP